MTLEREDPGLFHASGYFGTGPVIVEMDGLAFHLNPRQFKRDRRRDNDAIRQGLLVLRFFYGDVVHTPDAMLRHVREVLRRRRLV
ncbi:very-short-patch-repair endonuclease [Arthrobacter sp. 1088]|uniref:DUF559 domain-containing protein n=1 Tax=Arthrobacter sp. 1088 TaxID=2817768 RepID=UPI002866D97A|nr:DUF559 domain-containing protein [Arthrobacter sp. 1088]MDR6686921.1 very-short-patch-repair endonuclease [Arthrobacter sp. 1088]